MRRSPCYCALCLPIRQRNRNLTTRRGHGRKAMSAKRTMSFNHRAKKFLKARGTCAGALIGFRNEQAERSSGVLQPRESRRAFAPRLIAAQRLQHLLARAHFQPPNAQSISSRRILPCALLVHDITELI